MKYKTGDGRRHATKAAALAHAGAVHRDTGRVVSVEDRVNTRMRALGAALVRAPVTLEQSAMEDRMQAQGALVQSLAPYVTGDDGALGRVEFLLAVRDRIADDIPGLTDIRAAYADLHSAARDVIDNWDSMSIPHDLAGAVRHLAELLEVDHVHDHAPDVARVTNIWRATVRTLGLAGKSERDIRDLFRAVLRDERED